MGDELAVGCRASPWRFAFSSSSPLQEPPWEEGSPQAALVEGEEERNPKL